MLKAECCCRFLCGAQALEGAGKSKSILVRAEDFAVRIVRLCSWLEDQSRIAGTIGHQLLRAGTAIGALVEEGHGAESDADFVHKHMIALKEARESAYWLRLIVRTETVDETRVRQLRDEAEEIAKMLGAIVRTKKRNMGKTVEKNHL